MNLDYVFFGVMVIGWIMLIGLWILFMRKAPKDGPDPGPRAGHRADGKGEPDDSRAERPG